MHEGSTEKISVAVRVRPLNEKEIENRSRIVAHRVQGEPQITLNGNKDFTFDHVFHMESTQDDIFQDCIQSMVEGCVFSSSSFLLLYFLFIK